MISPEIFYLHLHGEQRGPYTAPQVDHLLNSGLIAQETLYWREGLEQWQPVTEIVALRKRANRWIRPALALAAILVILGLIRIFGPIVTMGWHESNQHDYTERAAYWRAREVIRNDSLPPGSIVDFAPFGEASVHLSPPGAAEVTIRGEVPGSDGNPHAASWRVAMKYNEKAREWTGVPAESPAPIRHP